MKLLLPVLACLGALAALSACNTVTPTSPIHALAEERYFLTFIKPVLENQCVACHSGSRPPSGLSLVQESSVYAPRYRKRAYVVPGDPKASLLYTAIIPGGSHPRVSPPLELRLSDTDLAAIYEWIEDGAVWPKAPEGFLVPRTLESAH